MLDIYKLIKYYLNKIEDNFNKINILFNQININIDYSKYIESIKKADIDNIFIYKNINKFVNKIGMDIFLLIKEEFKNIYDDKKINFYFNNLPDFFRKINNIFHKKKKYNYYDKKNKYDDTICKVGILLNEILTNLLFFDPLTSKDYIFREFYKYIKSCDLKNINNIRNIIFNLLITNITGTDIIKTLTEYIINDEKIDIKKKIKILDICREAEYGIIKGRREINQFDNLIITIMNILTI
jgi:hypothetical protein